MDFNLLIVIAVSVLAGYVAAYIVVCYRTRSGQLKSKRKPEWVGDDHWADRINELSRNLLQAAAAYDDATAAYDNAMADYFHWLRDHLGKTAEVPRDAELEMDNMRRIRQQLQDARLAYDKEIRHRELQ